jgi:hypothetical protein
LLYDLLTDKTTFVSWRFDLMQPLRWKALQRGGSDFASLRNLKPGLMHASNTGWTVFDGRLASCIPRAAVYC